LELEEDRGPAGFTYRSIPSKPGVRPSLFNFQAPTHVSILEEAGPPAVAAEAASDEERRAVRPGSANPNILSNLVGGGGGEGWGVGFSLGSFHPCQGRG
jgi:hypothetical protein